MCVCLWRYVQQWWLVVRVCVVRTLCPVARRRPIEVCVLLVSWAALLPLVYARCHVCWICVGFLKKSIVDPSQRADKQWGHCWPVLFFAPCPPPLLHRRGFAAMLRPAIATR